MSQLGQDDYQWLTWIRKKIVPLVLRHLLSLIYSTKNCQESSPSGRVVADYIYCWLGFGLKLGWQI